MKYLVSWTEYHSAVVKAEDPEEAEHEAIGCFDAGDTFNGQNSIIVIDEDNPCVAFFDDVIVQSKGGLIRQSAHLLYDACVEFVRKVECGDAVSKRSYKQMKQALDLIHNREERTKP